MAGPALAKHLTDLRLDAWRGVEDQTRTATARLTDDLAGQRRLEELLDAAKPPVPDFDGVSRVWVAGLDYLLRTPFRYPPLRHGSRFGRRHETGIWYGAAEPRTVLYERAYYRFLDADRTAAGPSPAAPSFTMFSVRIDTDRGLDLLGRSLRSRRRRCSDPRHYAEAQVFGTAARAAGAHAIRYPSAREPGPTPGACVAVLHPRAFRPARIRTRQQWVAESDGERLLFRHGDEVHLISRSVYLVGGALPQPVS